MSFALQRPFEWKMRSCTSTKAWPTICTYNTKWCLFVFQPPCSVRLGEPGKWVLWCKNWKKKYIYGLHQLGFLCTAIGQYWLMHNSRLRISVKFSIILWAYKETLFHPQTQSTFCCAPTSCNRSIKVQSNPFSSIVRSVNCLHQEQIHKPHAQHI